MQKLLSQHHQCVEECGKVGRLFWEASTHVSMASTREQMRMESMMMKNRMAELSTRAKMLTECKIAESFKMEEERMEDVRMEDVKMESRIIAGMVLETLMLEQMLSPCSWFTNRSSLTLRRMGDSGSNSILEITAFIS